MPDTLDFADLGEAIGNATAVLRNNAATTGLDAPVPARPGRTVGALVVDQGLVHRRATAALRGEPPVPESTVRREAAGASDLLEWLDDGMADLLNALASDPDDRQAWFYAGAASQPRQREARRLCHLATLGAVDAMSVRLGRAPRVAELWFSPALARDGLDWLAGDGASTGLAADPYLIRLAGSGIGR